MKQPVVEVVTPRARLAHHTEAVDATVVSADGSLLVSVSPDRGCILWDLASGVRKAELHCGPEKARVRAVAFDKKQRWLACASADGGVYLWAVSRDDQLRAKRTYALRTMQRDAAEACSVVFSSCGRFLACGYGNGAVRKWNLVANPPQLVDMHEAHTNRVNTTAWTASGLLASGSSDRTIVLWQLKRSFKNLLSHCGSVASIAFSPDDSILGSCGLNDKVVLWDVRVPSEAKVTHRIAGCIPYASSLAFARDPGGKILLLAALGNGTVRVWDLPVRATSSLPPRQRVLLQGEGDDVLCLGVSQDASVVATGNSNKQILLWSVKLATSNFLAASPTVEIASGTPGHPPRNLSNGHIDNTTLKTPNPPLRARTLPGNNNGAAGSAHGGTTFPAGSVHGGATFPAGSVHGGATFPAGSVHGGATFPAGSVHGGATFPAGSVRGGATLAAQRVGLPRDHQRWIIRTARFRVFELIGTGHTGDVCRGLLDDTTTIAIKRYHRDRPLATAHGVQTAEMLGHYPYLREHTLQVYGACDRLEHVLFEYSVLGSLDKYIGRLRYKASIVPGFDANLQTFLGDDIKWKWTRGVADGLAALHRAGLIHGNLRPSKVLLRSVEKPVLGCTGLRQPGVIGEGTLNFQAPEVATGRQESRPSSDSWSFGMILYYIWTEGMVPYAGVQNIAELRKLVGERLKLPYYAKVKLSKVRGDILALMRRCLASDPKQRPLPLEIRELVKRAYLTTRERQPQRSSRNEAAGMPPRENFAKFPSTPIDVDNEVDGQEGHPDVHKSVPLRSATALGTAVDQASAATTQPAGSPLPRAPEVQSIREPRPVNEAVESETVAESQSTALVVASPIKVADQRSVVGQLKLEPGGNESAAEEPAAFNAAEGALVATRKAEKLPNHDNCSLSTVTPLVTAATSEESTLHRKRRRLSDTDETLSALRALEISRNDELLRSWAGRLENDGVDTLGDLNEVMSHHKNKQAAIDWLQSIDIPMGASVKLCRYYY